MDATPAWIKRIAGHADGLGSALIVESDADVVVLRRVLATVLRYRRPLLARVVWAFLGILHRRTARQVVAGGLRQGDRSGDAALERS